jgi:diamine N-acetyltransferase
MYLRKICKKDAEYMLEWMSDPDLTRNFRFNAQNVSIESVIDFIDSAAIDSTNLHYAIADDEDEYLGTISLKGINHTDKNAEYAIALRKKAIGTGIASEATRLILKIAFSELKLNKVYLNVLSENSRAIRFYEKFGFEYEGEFKDHIYVRNQLKSLKWYAIFSGAGDNGKI